MTLDRAAFTTTLERTFDMNGEEAKELAALILDHFGDGDELDDELLDTELRSVFYTLESKRLVSFRRVEYRRSGDMRRAFFWRLRPEALGDPAPDLTYEPADLDVYASLPSDAWQHAS